MQSWSMAVRSPDDFERSVTRTRLDADAGSPGTNRTVAIAAPVKQRNLRPTMREFIDDSSAAA
jgi:hypothetical protein